MGNIFLTEESSIKIYVNKFLSPLLNKEEGSLIEITVKEFLDLFHIDLSLPIVISSKDLINNGSYSYCSKCDIYYSNDRKLKCPLCFIKNFGNVVKDESKTSLTIRRKP